VLEDEEQMISNALGIFLAGFERISENSAEIRRAPMKAVG